MPEVAPALVEILFLALVFFTIALAFSAQKISEALLGGIIRFLEAIPLIGAGLAGPFKAVEQAVSSACGAIVAKCEALVGASFHVLARFTDWLWRQTVAEAAALLHVAKLVGDHVYALTGLRALVHRLEKVYHGIEHGVKTLTKEYHGIDRRLHKLERELAGGIGADVIAQLHGLEKEWRTFKTKELPGIEAGVAGIPTDIQNVESWASKQFVSASEAGVTAALVTALAALGLSGLNCESNPLKNNRNACGLWGDLADLLGLALALGLALDFETFVHDAQAATEVTVGAVEAFVGLS